MRVKDCWRSRVKRWTFLISIARIDVSGITPSFAHATELQKTSSSTGCIICGNKDSINQKTVLFCSINRRVCSCSNAVARPTVPIPSSRAWLIHCQRVWLMHGVCAFVLAFERGGNSKILRRNENRLLSLLYFVFEELNILVG